MDKNDESQKNVFIAVKVRKIKQWTEKEDLELIRSAKKHDYKNWKKVSENLPGRTSIQCSARYKRIRPGLVKGNWTSEDDILLLKLVKIYGKNWSAISKFIPSRTGKQIRDRYLNSLDPALNKEKFGDAEDKMIIELYLKYGTSWSKIAKKMKNRTGDMIKNRFYSTLRRQVHQVSSRKRHKNAKRVKNQVLKKNQNNNLLQNSIENINLISEPTNLKSDLVPSFNENEIVPFSDQKETKLEIIRNEEIQYLNSNLTNNKILSDPNLARKVIDKLNLLNDLFHKYLSFRKELENPDLCINNDAKCLIDIVDLNFKLQIEELLIEEV